MKHESHYVERTLSLLWFTSIMITASAARIGDTRFGGEATLAS
jgi:hypothetical protein